MIVALLLVSKDRIHRFAREIVSAIELEDAIKFFVVAFVVLPLLPDRPFGPYGVLNPAKIWLLVVLLTGIGWIDLHASGCAPWDRGGAFSSPVWPADSSRPQRRRHQWAG